MGQYSHSIEYFDRLQRRVRMAPNAAEMLDTSRQVESGDPSRSGLSVAERARRTASALALAGSHIEECAREHGEAIEVSPATTEIQKLHALQHQMGRDWSEISLRNRSDRIDAAMSLVFEMENAPAQQCGEPKTGADRIL
jgi:hypothetical protein